MPPWVIISSMTACEDTEKQQLVEISSSLVKVITDLRENTVKQMNSIRDLERKARHREESWGNGKKALIVTEMEGYQQSGQAAYRIGEAVWLCIRQGVSI